MEKLYCQECNILIGSIDDVFPFPIPSGYVYCPKCAVIVEKRLKRRGD